MRLFWKIFLSFWLLVTTLVIVVLVTNWNRRSDRYDYFRQQQIALVGNSTDFAVAEYERDGAPGLEHALSRINTRINGELWILDDNNRPIQGGELPKAIQPALTMADDVTARGEELLVRLPFEHEGKRYMALARLRMRKPPPLPFFRDPAAQIPLGVLLSSIVCFVLARWIARPVSALRRSAQRISEGELDARVDGKYEGRDELGQLTRDFNLMAERLQQTLASQQRMFADVSHELRSPLSRLTLALELAKQRSGPAAATALERIEIETERLNELVQQILRLAKLEAGVFRDRYEVLSVTEMLDQVAKDAEIEATAKQCAVVLKNEVSALVEGDADVLRSALENVVRNAIQHSPAASQIELVQRKAGSSSVAIEVADRGPGVKPEDLGRMFQPFYRGDHSRQTPTGVGLGLAIAERAVVAHRGSIRAANREQTGLKVEIRLPMYGIES
ncbi:MAG TPA: ATP-binding protein [Terriglobales bacterium]|nr:ATP-binding protein [Terriglobales bacterium]